MFHLSGACFIEGMIIKHYWVAVRDYPHIMENQMEKKMENEMETGEYKDLRNLNSPRHPASGVQIPFPLYSPLQTHLSLATPHHGGWPSPARPSRMNFSLAQGSRLWRYAAGAFFVQNGGLLAFRGPTPRRPLEAPGAPGRPLQERPGTAWKAPTCMDEAE